MESGPTVKRNKTIKRFTYQARDPTQCQRGASTIGITKISETLAGKLLANLVKTKGKKQKPCQAMQSVNLINLWRKRNIYYILSSCAEGFSMGYIRIHRLDALDLVPAESIIHMHLQIYHQIGCDGPFMLLL